MIGHGHPRLIEAIGPTYKSLGFEVVRDFDEVMAVADVYAVDNSSTLFEFAATDRPVVVMNAPWYRRNVEMPPRFWWGADVGVQVDEPDDLGRAIAEALSDKPRRAERRRKVVAMVYDGLDGGAAYRAAQAIIEHVVEGAP